MPTLLMRLRGPMMSWGDHSRFTIRDSRREPTKSAVIGLLCSALGRPRWESVTDLTVLKMGVRVNQEGVLLWDYHTVQEVVYATGKGDSTVLSNRYYVADGDYLVGLEGEDVTFLSQLDQALRTPVWQLYLGRKSFVPSKPVAAGVVDAPLSEALRSYPHDQGSTRLRYVLETPDSLDVRQDVPVSWQKRLFGSRCVHTDYWEVG
ncbi:MAG: type I-E CRISPR-associated protein Cas5/CasD [Snowella sp.]|nr:type I-E CRISPR-associated protein Cas5/CasD [Snowella sp.]